MANLRGVKDNNPIELKCPKCHQLLMYVSRGAKGRIYPYCKKCRTNYDINLPLLTRLMRDAKSKNKKLITGSSDKAEPL